MLLNYFNSLNLKSLFKKIENPYVAYNLQTNGKLNLFLLLNGVVLWEDDETQESSSFCSSSSTSFGRNERAISDINKHSATNEAKSATAARS